MEKKELLGVRNRPLPGKRRRKAAAAGGGLAEAIAAYLSSDSYMYAPVVSDTQAPAAGSPAEAVSYEYLWLSRRPQVRFIPRRVRFGGSLERTS